MTLSRMPDRQMLHPMEESMHRLYIRCADIGSMMTEARRYGIENIAISTFAQHVRQGMTDYDAVIETIDTIKRQHDPNFRI
jgi:hypothetical protein